MRALHIGKYYPPFYGGMENYMGDLLPALTKRGVKIAALVHRHRSGVSPKPYVYQSPCYGRLLYAPISPQFPLRLTRLIKDFKPDLLHLHLPNTSAFWALAIAKARSIPWVIHWHADVDAQSNQYLAYAYHAYKPLERHLLSKSDAIIVTSPPYLESSQPLAPWSEKCRIIPLGRDSATFPQLSPNDVNIAQQQWGNTQRKVLAVSRMSYYKGLEYLIQATAQIDSIKLIIVGPGTHDKLLHYTQMLGIENRVWLADVQPQKSLHALMATSDCLCVPSIERTEAFGLVLLEAMYYGKPTIASDIRGSGVGWVVQHGITGKLVPTRNVRSLAQELHNLGHEKLAWIDMGRNGRSRFNEAFDIRYSAEQILLLYRDILNEAA
jgi:rhamnosyl/mannosyltransferase